MRNTTVDMRSPAEIRRDNEAVRKSGVVANAPNRSAATTYVVDMATGLVMTRAEYLSWDRS